MNLFCLGMIWAPYPHWKILRSFAISALREEGMGKAYIEPRILDEVHRYISRFLEPNFEQPIDVSHSISLATCNIVSQMLYCRRFDYDDEKYNKVTTAIDKMIAVTSKVALLRNLPFGGLIVKLILSKASKLGQEVVIPQLQTLIDEHKESLDKENPRDVTDRFIIHSQTAEGERTFCFSGEEFRN